MADFKTRLGKDGNFRCRKIKENRDTRIYIYIYGHTAMRLSNRKSHIKKKKRTCRLVNHFIDNAHDHPFSSLKFVLIEQVSNKTEEFLEQREGYWQAQLWTYESYGFYAKKEFNSGRRREFLS